MTATLTAASPSVVRSPAEASHAVVRAVLEGGHHAIFGAPGSGRSTTAVEVMAALAAQGGTEDVLLLAPTRRAADRLRDALTARLPLTVGRVLVRTPASFAFSVLRARAALLGEPPPTLLTGADQDAALTQLLLGHAAGDGRDPGWPQDVPAEALTLATFRHELRDVLMRAAEAGWDGRELAHMGERYGRPAWVACGHVLQEYEEVTRLGETTPDRGTRLDAATVLYEAVQALTGWETDLPQHPRPRLRAVVHDDFQDATLATARLLRALADDGTQLVLLGDPDSAVQTFRGAVPGLLERATSGPAGMLAGVSWPRGAASARRARFAPEPRVGEFGAQQHVLPVVWRGDARLRGAVTSVCAGLPALGDSVRRRSPAVLQEAGSSVRVMVARSAPEEARLISRALREHRLRDGVAWDSMAVLARSSAQLPALRRGLRAGGVPVAASRGELPLAAEPAVRPLLHALELVAAAVAEAEDAGAQEGPEAPEWLTADAVSQLVLSPIGGMDAVGLRALRRALRSAEAAAGGTRDSDALLVAAVTMPEAVLGLHRVPSRLRHQLGRVTAVLAAGTAAAAAGEGMEHVLWALWDATGLAQLWRTRALGTGASAERADSDLDAVVALFRAAETFAQLQEGAGADAFVRHLQTEEFATDTLASTGTRSAVEVLTAAAAAGREWDVVVVAGVQEDVWPDLRLRARLLDPIGVSDLAAGRGCEVARPADARRAVLADEQRVFVSAVSRTRRHLMVTAVQDADTRPSHFLDLVDPPPVERPGSDGVDAVRAVSHVPPALDLRGLVAELRRVVLDGGPRATAAADLLATLAARDVPGADPAQWWGHAVSTDAPLWAEQQRVPVKPSSLTTFEACDLRWALETSGGRAGQSLSAEVGTLVHQIASDAPRGTPDELLGLLDRHWHELGLGDGWGARQQRRRAEAMVRRLAEYQLGVPGRVETEVPFEVEVGRADLTGRVDRVEHLDGGAVRIVDLKTSATAVTKDAAAQHPQLAAYQAAVAADGFDGATPGGARLVYLGTSTPSATTRDQPPPQDDWPQRLVAEAAERMSASSFTARAGTHCRMCPVRSSCPVQPEGSRVVGR